MSVAESDVRNVIALMKSEYVDVQTEGLKIVCNWCGNKKFHNVFNGLRGIHEVVQMCATSSDSEVRRCASTALWSIAESRPRLVVFAGAIPALIDLARKVVDNDLVENHDIQRQCLRCLSVLAKFDGTLANRATDASDVFRSLSANKVCAHRGLCGGWSPSFGASWTLRSWVSLPRARVLTTIIISPRAPLPYPTRIRSRSLPRVSYANDTCRT